MRKKAKQKKSRIPVVKVVDLFCGAGGLAYGLKSAGFDIAVGVDLDPACRHPFEANCGGEFVEKSVADITKAELTNWFNGADVRILAGCAPCQPFSTYSQSRRTPDARWELLRSFLKLAVELRPEIVTMENVCGLAAKGIWREFVEGLEDANYHITWGEILCSDFGVPQSRKRLVLIASRLGPIDMPTAAQGTEPRTVRDAIGDLPPLIAGERDDDDAMHIACRLSPTNLKRIRASKPGGTWRDWPKNLRAACHRKETGETYPSVYGRMSWDEVAPTMTTQCFGYGNGRFGHPEQDRAITLREAAILQSFPASYSFIPENGRLTFDKVGTLIGNAVPPKLGEAIGRRVWDHLNATGLSST
jgi:DNA (cytosine-5)-methyltransferase 1